MNDGFNQQEEELTDGFPSVEAACVPGEHNVGAGHIQAQAQSPIDAQSSYAKHAPVYKLTDNPNHKHTVHAYLYLEGSGNPQVQFGVLRDTCGYFIRSPEICPGVGTWHRHNDGRDIVVSVCTPLDALIDVQVQRTVELVRLRDAGIAEAERKTNAYKGRKKAQPKQVCEPAEPQPSQPTQISQSSPSISPSVSQQSLSKLASLKDQLRRMNG